MTNEQLAALKAHIDASADLNVHPNTPDGNFEVARLLNLPASPAFYVFRSSAGVDEIIGGISAPEYLDESKVTPAARDLLRLMLHNGTFDPQPDESRSKIISIFPASAPNSRAGILSACTRQANRAESVLAENATGPGGGNGSARTSSALLAFEGTVSRQDVETARNLP